MSKPLLVRADPPEAEDVEDPSDFDALFFRRVKLSKEDRADIEKDLGILYREAVETRGDLDQMLAHWNDMSEGIAQPKDFPWQDSSNLFVPITEIALNNIHASARQTMLKADQLTFVKQIGFSGTADAASRAEKFLNYKCMMEIPLVDRLNQMVWSVLRDGTAIAQVQWGITKEKVSRIIDFMAAKDLLSKLDRKSTRLNSSH